MIEYLMQIPRMLFLSIIHLYVSCDVEWWIQKKKTINNLIKQIKTGTHKSVGC